MANLDLRPKRTFNLLKPYSAPPTVWDRAYDWLVTRARLVLIGVEIIVAISFVSKVIVDVQAKSLDEELVSSNFELNSYATSIEPHLRSIQQRALSYANLWQASSSFTAIVTEINSFVLDPTADIQIVINGNQVSVSGKEDINTLIQIEEKMKVSPTFSSTKISLNTTENQDTGEKTSQYVLTASIVQKTSRVIAK